MKEASITINKVTRKYNADGSGYWGITGMGVDKPGKVWFRTDEPKVTRGAIVKVRYAYATAKPGIVFRNKVEILPSPTRAEVLTRLCGEIADLGEDRISAEEKVETLVTLTEGITLAAAEA